MFCYIHFSYIGSEYFHHILLLIQLCKNFTFVHFMVAFEYYQVESEFKYSLRNTRDRENQTKMFPS